jgi:hypothetical protein
MSGATATTTARSSVTTLANKLHDKRRSAVLVLAIALILLRGSKMAAWVAPAKRPHQEEVMGRRSRQTAEGMIARWRRMRRQKQEERRIRDLMTPL